MGKRKRKPQKIAKDKNKAPLQVDCTEDDNKLSNLNSCAENVRQKYKKIKTAESKKECTEGDVKTKSAQSKEQDILAAAVNENDCLGDSDKVYHSFLKNLASNDLDSKPLQEICEALSDHYKYKMKSIIKCALKYMRHCRRKVLNTSDFSKGLMFCKEVPIICFFNSGERNCRETSTVKLGSVIRFPLMGMKVQATFVNLENTSIIPVSDNLKLYFSCVVQIIKSANDEKSCSFIMKNLRENYKISSLVPYFLDFFLTEISNQKDLAKSLVIFRAIESLFLNNYLYFGITSQLTVLIYSLLKCLLDPSYKHLDPWLSKDVIADALEKVFKRVDSEVLCQSIIEKLMKILKNFQLPLIIHYSALIAAKSMGLTALARVVPVYIHPFFQHFNYDSLDIHKKEHFFMLQDILKQSCHLMVKYYCKHILQKSTLSALQCDLSVSEMESRTSLLKSVSEVSECVLQNKFCEYFEDALVPAFVFSGGFITL